MQLAPLERTIASALLIVSAAPAPAVCFTVTTKLSVALTAAEPPSRPIISFDMSTFAPGSSVGCMKFIVFRTEIEFASITKSSVALSCAVTSLKLCNMKFLSHDRVTVLELVNEVSNVIGDASFTVCKVIWFAERPVMLSLT